MQPLGRAGEVAVMGNRMEITQVMIVQLAHSFVFIER